MKRLTRSKKNRIIAGVCGGIGEYLDIDPTVIRVIWAILTVASYGTGLLAYLLAWVIIPEAEPTHQTEASGAIMSSEENKQT